MQDYSKRTVVNLQEEKRKKERQTLLFAKNKLRNEYRISRGLQPIPENADLESIKEIEPIDILLIETAQILFDLVTPN